MKTHDFTTTIVVSQTATEVFNAINQPQNWWTGDIIGSAEKLNDEFEYRYKDFHYSKQRVVEMIPDKMVVWLVADSALNYAEDKSEWTGTKISFEITEQGNQTEVRFTHEGLVPEFECFDSCSNAWTDLIREGLFTLITKGETQPVFLG
jgi:hypothetical protein